jgi:hypothetical protein
VVQYPEGRLLRVAGKKQEKTGEKGVPSEVHHACIIVEAFIAPFIRQS